MTAIPMPISDGDLESTSLGKALIAGKIVVTMESLKTGTHVTLSFQCKAKVAGHWRNQPYYLASHVFIDVPNGSMEIPNDKVGTLYPSSSEARWAGFLYPDRNADPARLWAACKVLDIALGKAEVEKAGSYRLLVAEYCMRCGRELTEPESIKAGLGPVCGKKVSAEYGRRHQAKANVQAAMLKAQVDSGQRPGPAPAPVGDPAAVIELQSTGNLLDL